MREQRPQSRPGIPCCAPPPEEDRSERVKLRSDMIQVVRDQHQLLQDWACEWARRSAQQQDDHFREITRLLGQLRDDVRELSTAREDTTDDGPAQPATMQGLLAGKAAELGRMAYSLGSPGGGLSSAFSMSGRSSTAGDRGQDDVGFDGGFATRIKSQMPSLDPKGSPHIERLRKKETKRKRWTKMTHKGSIVIETETPALFEGQPWLAKVVDSPAFNLAVGVLILLNVLLGGVEMDADVRLAFEFPPGPMPDVFLLLNRVFATIFTVEIGLRLFAHRRTFFIGEDGPWNTFDLVVVLFQWIEEVLQLANVNQLRIIRLTRVVRSMRVIRVIHFFRSLRLMVFAVFHSLVSLVWALLLLFIVMYLFSIIFVHATVQHLREENMEAMPTETEQSITDELGAWELRNLLQKNFPTLPRAVFSMLMSISGGIDWYDIIRPLLALNPVYGGVFSAYVVFVLFGMLNVLNAVFIDHTMRITDRDLLINEEQNRTDHFLQDMQDLFREAAHGKVGQLSRDQLVKYLRNERVLSYMAGHQLDVSDVDIMFKLLDADKSGMIDEEEWLLGTLRLKGQARCLDVLRLFASLDKLVVQVARVETALGLEAEVASRSPSKASAGAI